MGVKSVVTDEMNASLTSTISLEEVREAAYQLGALKAPGPDGFPGIFYQKYWRLINEVIFYTSTDFKEGRVCLKQMNKTHIIMIPKVPNLEKTTKFRPISLCNNSYKLLSRYLQIDSNSFRILYHGTRMLLCQGDSYKTIYY